MSSNTLQKEDCIEEIRKGLREPQKQIASKFFYNKRGSELFEEICELEEYYLTRTEIQILSDHMDGIASVIGKNSILLELGSGSTRKIRILLDHLQDLHAYCPIDISKDFVTREANELKKDYQNLAITPIIADYTKDFELPSICSGHLPSVYFYPGSSIGNFSHETAQELFKNLHKTHNKASLLIGVDLKKDKATLEQAYNDSKGITAQFNLNILDHINELIGNCFNRDLFEHYAFYNEEEGRIEMHLRSQEAHDIALNGEVISIKKDETILTEYSYKYSLRDFDSLLNGFYSIQNCWTDAKETFALLYCTPKKLSKN